MALHKYFQRLSLRQFSVTCQKFTNEPDLYKSYRHVEKHEEKEKGGLFSKWGDHLMEQSWDESLEMKKFVLRERRKAKKEEFSDNRTEIFMKIQRFRLIFMYKGEFTKFLRKRIREMQKLEQSFFERRMYKLGPDIASAYFIVNRGGRVKFLGYKDWITRENWKNTLPNKYEPGIYVVAIDATNTGLMYEGVDCLRYLNKLQWLRLKGLEQIDDYCLDIISGRYGPQLEYLDISDCTKITHHGLACMYRFKHLRGLNVTGLNHTHEFLLSCLMIEDLIPNINIIGVDYSNYLKGKTVDTVDGTIDGTIIDGNKGTIEVQQM